MSITCLISGSVTGHSRMWLIAENIRGFAVSRSPLVLFMFCLGLFAVLLLILAHVVNIRDIQNPDKQDWNSFLDGFKKVQFCMVMEENSGVEGSQSEHLGEHSLKDVLSAVHDSLPGGQVQATTEVSVTSDPNEIISVQVPMLAEIKPTADFVSRSHSLTYLSTSLAGNQLGIEGANADTKFNVSLSLDHQWNSSLCPSSKNCTPVNIYTCVTLHAPAGVFPNSRPPRHDLCDNANSSGTMENHYRIVGKKRNPGTFVCDSQTGITFNHYHDPTLMIMLSLQDRSTINLHLVNTSLFLFVMVITLLCFAMVKGRHPGKTKKHHEFQQVVTES